MSLNSTTEISHRAKRMPMHPRRPPKAFDFADETAIQPAFWTEFEAIWHVDLFTVVKLRYANIEILAFLYGNGMDGLAVPAPDGRLQRDDIVVHCFSFHIRGRRIDTKSLALLVDQHSCFRQPLLTYDHSVKVGQCHQLIRIKFSMPRCERFRLGLSYLLTYFDLRIRMY